MVRHIREKGISPIALSTAMSYIENTSQFLDYAIKIETLDKNRLHNSPDIPTDKQIEEAKGKQSIKRLPLDNDDLNALFSKSDWFREEKIDSTLKTWPNRFYIPLLSLFGGMRLNEASQLYVNDILEENGIHYMRVDKLNPHQKLKNRSSKRRVPIHPLLIELGFLKYVNSLKEQNIERVFHQLGVNKRGFGKPFGGKFRNQNFRNEWLNEAELEKNGETKVFHCFRHNFMTQLEDYATAQKFSSIVGHKMSNYKYIHPPLEKLAEAINQMNYDEIDFTHIIQAVNNIYREQDN